MLSRLAWPGLGVVRVCSTGLGVMRMCSTSIRRERPAPIKITEKAASRIKDMVETKGDGVIGVKVSVKRRGCNGYSYTMNYASADDLAAKKDAVVQSYGATVLVDPKATFYIAGTVMDYEETELLTEFTFVNPNSKGKCGCGESFNV